MVKIRLRRQGATKRPFYRLVIADSKSPRDGRFVEEIGFYNPTTDPATLHIDQDAALRWLRQGAQPSETVRALLKRSGVLQRLRAGDQATATGDAPQTPAGPVAKTKPKPKPKVGA